MSRDVLSRWAGPFDALRRRLAVVRHDPLALVALISVLAALTPILVSAIRSASRGWVPIGDDGLLLLRSADVATSNHPWLGTWTSASLSAGTDFNNPGPLLFDLLAIPVKLFGYGVGMPVGMAIVNGASVLGAAIVAWRQARARAVVPVMVAAAGIAWTMGSELLIDPWQPHSMMLPFFLLVTVLWGVVCGDLKLVALFAGVSSLLVQTHVSYSFLVLYFTFGVVAAVVLHTRRRPSLRTGLRRIGVTAATVVLVLWSQPLVEQFFGAGRGNLTRLLASSSTDQTKIGLRLGTRLVADVLVMPPWFARWSFVDAVPATPYTATAAGQRLIVQGVTSLPVATAAVLLFVLFDAALLWWALLRRQRVVAAALATALGLIVCAIAAMIVMPSGILGLSPHQMRWLWTMSAFNLVALAASAVVLARLELTARSRTPTAARAKRPTGIVALSVGAAAAVLFAASAVPTYYQDAGPTADHWARRSIAAMMEQMSVLQGSGPLVFDDSGLRFAEPYSGPVMARLGELGVRFEVENPGLQRQVGDGRRISGTATGRLYLLEGQQAVPVPPGVDRVAFVPGLSDAQIGERDALVAAWTTQLADGLVTLDADGQAALRSGALGLSQAQIDGLDDPQGVVAGGSLPAAAAQGWLDLPDDDVRALIRLQELQTRWRFLTVGLFLAPLSP